jgi:hypothetical protein
MTTTNLIIRLLAHAIDLKFENLALEISHHRPPAGRDTPYGVFIFQDLRFQFTFFQKYVLLNFHHFLPYFESFQYGRFLSVAYQPRREVVW